MSGPRIDISESFTWEEGLPRPQWGILTTWVETRVADDARYDAWTDICRQWLERLQTELGNSYRVSESTSFLALHPEKTANIAELLQFGEYCCRHISKTLPDVAQYPETGKHVIVVLHNSDRYYQYLSAYYPDGHHGDSAGVHIREGYSHIALHGSELCSLQNTLAHELTHAALQHLGMPLWIEEGLTQTYEHNLTSRNQILVTAEMAQEHKRYWKKHGLDAFWRGEGFTRPGRIQMLSYQLAEITMRLMIERFRPRWFGLDKGPTRRFFAFLQNANELDCGAAAAKNHLGSELGELVGEFLGPGDWEPSL